MVKQFPIKLPSELITVLFDFSLETTAVTGPTVTVSVFWSAGTPDPSPSAIKSGSPTVDGTTLSYVYQHIVGGLDLNDYSILCTATAANGDILTVPAVLPVRALPA